MPGRILRFFTIPLVTLAAVSYMMARPDDRSFRERLTEYIDVHGSGQTGAAGVTVSPSPAEQGDPLSWNQEDWQRYVLSPSYMASVAQRSSERTEDTMDIVTYGSMRMTLGYGASRFTDSKYRTSDSDRPTTSLVTPGWNPQQELLLHMEGRAGRRVTVYIDHDSRRRDNHYLMQYRAVEDDEMIREINAGEIDISFNNSRYAVYDNGTAKGLGVDMTLRKNKLQVKAFGSMMRGEVAVDYFKGNSSAGSAKLADYRFARRTYYQVEPFRRYDNLTAVPNAATVYSSRTITSSGDDTLYTVGIESSGFEIYMDDQDPKNNYGGSTLSMDGGYYRKLSQGTDYSVDYDSGLVTFLRTITPASRIYVLYSLRSGTTSDPSALAPGEGANPSSDKYFVFIKYGESLNEDTVTRNLSIDAGEMDRNGDGRVNIDAYEVRSFYFVGDGSLLQDGFRITFTTDAGTVTSDQKTLIGGYTVDYSSGIIRFNRREPFRTVLDAAGTGATDIIYREVESSQESVYSIYGIRVDYYRDRRTFQLSHGNILPGSIKIKVDNREISTTLYSVDMTSGFLTFLNSDSPKIESDSQIEVRYEYLPFESAQSAFVGGVRTDYFFSRYLSFGGSLLFNRNGATATIPRVENAPGATTVMEGDVTAYLDGRKIRDLVHDVTGRQTGVMPVEMRTYGEYARSYRETNTFGKGLVDSMDAGDQVTELSMSEKEWTLSSLPSGSIQTDRGLLQYRYYRDAGDPGELKGESYGATVVPYATKPGPYNVATGHVDNSIIHYSSQRSLVFEYDLSSGSVVSVAGGGLPARTTDLSSMQYLEISCRLEATEGSGTVDLQVDLGRLDEDSDGDGLLDTEDANGNGEIDYDIVTAYSEDRGYTFNPSGGTATVVGSGPGLSSATMGDGILNTEDLNGNGVLDGSTTENVYSLTTTVSSGSWQTIRVYVDSSSLTGSQKDILSQVRSMRFSVKRGTSSSGKLYIDAMRLVSTSWEGSTDGSSSVRVTMVSSLNDSDYRADAFLFEKRSVYQSLYGKRDTAELSAESESALKVTYTLSPGGSVSVEKNLDRSIDLRDYRSLVFWLNPRTIGAGDTLSVVLGSSENDTVTYNVQMDTPLVWQEVRLAREGTDGPSSSSGEIDYRHISIIRFVLTNASGSSGEIWLNDIYAAEAVTRRDSAYWFENEIRITEPLGHRKDGRPLFSDITVKYQTRGNGEDFSSVGKVSTDTRESAHQLFSSCTIMPAWRISADYSQTTTVTDSNNDEVPVDKRGTVRNNSLVFISDYGSSGLIPSVRFSYRLDRLDGEREDDLSGVDVRVLRETTSHSPSIDLRETLSVPGGTIQGNCSLNMKFYRADVRRGSSDVDSTTLSTLTSLQDREARQKSDAVLSLRYVSGMFYIKPEISSGSEEIVEARGTIGETYGINGEVSGSYHLPFIYSDNIRFLSRTGKSSFTAGFTPSDWIRPEYRIEYSRNENGFNDYTDSVRALSGQYERQRDASNSLNSQISIPLGPGIRGKGKFLRNLSMIFRRNVTLDEMDVPYEGEGTSAFREDYGIRRVLSNLGGAGYNIFRYFPGYFLTGRGSAANARDYVNKTMNHPIRFEDDSSSGYTNRLKLLDDLSLQSTFDFDRINVTAGAGINGLCERTNVEGIPGETVTRYVNMRITCNLMKIFSIWFFRPNNQGQPYHAATLDLLYSFNRADMITSAIREDRHSPGAGITFKWGRSSLGINWGLEYRLRSARDYISRDDAKRDSMDDIYIENLSLQSQLRERETGHTFSVLYETDVPAIYDFFAQWYELTAKPVFTFKYSLVLNRYDYTESISPQPYDMHRFDTGLTLDLHRNVQGGITGIMALESYRNRETGHVVRQIITYAVNLSFALVF